MQRIGHYEIDEIIGEGGMGTVFLGRDVRFDRPVAIKALHPQLRRDPEVVVRFNSEAVIQAKLNHPNIVTVYDFIAEDEMLAMVMEYLPERPLDRIIDEAQGPLPVARALAIFSQVLDGVGYAHEHGLVHRDLKPSNVLTQTVGNREIAKVADFGVAKILGSEKLRTATTAKIGTLCYMSPEQVQSPKNVDHRSDIYSLGVMLYEIVTGRLPFDADTEFELMRRTVQEPPIPVRQLNPTLPVALEEVIAKALAKQPEQRFSDCREFQVALAVALGKAESAAGAAQGTPARTETKQRSEDNPAAKNRSRSRLAAIVAAACVVAVLLWAMMSREASQDDGDGVTRPTAVPTGTSGPTAAPDALPAVLVIRSNQAGDLAWLDGESLGPTPQVLRCRPASSSLHRSWQ